MNIIVLEKIPEDPEIILAWNNLVFSMERPEVFFTHQWALAANVAFSHDLSPLIFLAYESGQLVGVAAMATNRGIFDTAFFLTASSADYCDIVSEPRNRAAVITIVLNKLDELGVRSLILANVPAESHTLRIIRDVAGSRDFLVHERPAYDCGIILLGDNEQRRSVLQTVRRKEREKRALKKLRQLGPVRITHLTEDRSQHAIQLLVAAQISRFLATNRISPLISEPRRVFLTELGKLLAPAGWLKVSQMEVDGTPIAWNYGFQFGESWFWYLPTFQIQYEALSPGSCLLRLLTEEACADPSVKRLDLGLGDEPYKQRFANAISSTRYVQLSKTLSRHLENVGRYRLATSVRRFPVIDKQIRNGRRFLGDLQNRIRKDGFIATTVHAFARIKRELISADEVVFFEAPPITGSEDETVIPSKLNSESIAVAAMNNADDEQTLHYLIRCAERLRKGRATGYYLQDTKTPLSHFLWLDLYAGFHISEIDLTLESRDAKAVMIFDCWTPAAQRGHGAYARAIRLTSAREQKQQPHVWIFCAAKNESSIRGILKAGFEYRFSIVRNRILGHSTLSRRVKPFAFYHRDSSE